MFAEYTLLAVCQIFAPHTLHKILQVLIQLALSCYQYPPACFIYTLTYDLKDRPRLFSKRKTAFIKFPSVWMNITDTAHPTIILRY